MNCLAGCINALYKTKNSPKHRQEKTRNTLDCDQSNVYSSRTVYLAISQGLFRSSSLYWRSAGDLPS